MQLSNMTTSYEYDARILNHLTVVKLLNSLNDEETDLIILWMSNAYTLEEIGRIIGQKYHGEDIKPSVIRYHRDKILKTLRKNFSI